MQTAHIGVSTVITTTTLFKTAKRLAVDARHLPRYSVSMNIVYDLIYASPILNLTE